MHPIQFCFSSFYEDHVRVLKKEREFRVGERDISLAISHAVRGPLVECVSLSFARSVMCRKWVARVEFLVWGLSIPLESRVGGCGVSVVAPCSRPNGGGGGRGGVSMCVVSSTYLGRFVLPGERKKESTPHKRTRPPRWGWLVGWLVGLGSAHPNNHTPTRTHALSSLLSLSLFWKKALVPDSI